MEQYPGQESQIFLEELPLIYAGFWQRFIALLIDSIILAIPIIFACRLLGIERPGGFMDGSFHFSIGTYFSINNLQYTLVSNIIGCLYFAPQESGPAQATFGKRALRIKVIGGDGQRITFLNAAGRYFSKFISEIILLIGYLMAAWDEQKQALHDKIANTYVVKQ